MYDVPSVQAFSEMQQKLYEGKNPLCKEAPEPRSAPSQLPFRCPRCGEHERFRSLYSLRAHLEYGHSYQTMHNTSSASPGSTENVLLDNKESTDTGCGEKCKGSAVDNAGKRNVRFKDGRETANSPSPCEESNPEPHGSGGSSEGQSSGPASTVSIEAHVRRRLEEMLQAADSSMERRLRRVSSELAHTDSELLRTQAQSRHLAQERQELFERERALSRQVDAAVTVIAALRQQLTESEQELERKEQEVISIHHFLEAAVHHEVCGKVRLQHFIENLLRRIALAEKLLEYYQCASSRPNCRTHTTSQTVENGPHRISKARSPGGAPAIIPETRVQSVQEGRAFPNPPRERLGSKQSYNYSGLCKPDYAGNMWNQRRRLAGYEA
ncbi:protein ZNF365 [Amia ocellicauda]|uniref:protein ZNF365 n=1 Tax=Amia ocellicauda TaxID=2972642 RepID=UPI0034647D95